DRADEGLDRRQLAGSVTTNQVLLGVGLIVALAVGSQVLASRLRISAIILLLPAGFTAAAITTDVNPAVAPAGRATRGHHRRPPAHRRGRLQHARVHRAAG